MMFFISYLVLNYRTYTMPKKAIAKTRHWRLYISRESPFVSVTNSELTLIKKVKTIYLKVNLS